MKKRVKRFLLNELVATILALGATFVLILIGLPEDDPKLMFVFLIFYLVMSVWVTWRSKMDRKIKKAKKYTGPRRLRDKSPF